jgi:hypothetical protein
MAGVQYRLFRSGDGTPSLIVVRSQAFCELLRNLMLPFDQGDVDNQGFPTTGIHVNNRESLYEGLARRVDHSLGGPCH